MKHLHHIIPRHAGGTDDPDNLIELTVEEHARAHYILWNQYGRWQDKVAWQCLYGKLGKEELILTVQTEAARDAWKNSSYREVVTKLIGEATKKLWQNPDYRNNKISKLKITQPKGLAAALSPDSKQKRKDSLKKIGHQQGSKNSMFGKMWITNGSHSYRINKEDPIPEGYQKGRVIKS